MASEIKVDTISEKTSASGVTIDSLLIKDQAIGNLLGGVVDVQNVSRLGNSTTGYQLETTSSTYADVPGFSVSITPKSTTNKVIILSDIFCWHTDTYGGLKFLENSSGSYSDILEKKYLGKQSDDSRGFSHAIFGVFTPGVTSAVTVKLQAKSWAESSPNRFRVNWYDATSSIILVEIGA